MHMCFQNKNLKLYWISNQQYAWIRMVWTPNILYIFARILNFVRNGEECNSHKTVWNEVGLPLADIGTNNVRED